jgi:hypothetical protein
MIKKLLLTAALLAPGLAYGQVSAPLDPPVTPAGSAVPAPAAAAGFTTKVIDIDFTALGSNPASYVTNCGAGASVPNQPSTWHFIALLSQTTDRQQCARTAIDNTTGTQALLYTFASTDWVAPYDDSGVLFFPAGITIGSNGTSWLPNEFYWEATMRSDHNTVFQNAPTATGHLNWWAFNASRTIPNNNGEYIENYDYFESYSAPQSNPGLWTPNQIQEWNPSGAITGWGSSFPTTADITSTYHKFAGLTTSDEHSQLYMCMWVDDGFIGCSSIPAGLATAAAYKYRDNVLALNLGVFSTPQNPRPTYDMHLWIKSFKVYSCANVATSTCPGTMVTHWPFP